MPSQTFIQRRAAVAKQLENSAFRHGTSAFRLGLIPMGTSDHLPIHAVISQKHGQPIELMSWNMLADDHLFNNFRNISGRDSLIDAIKQQQAHGCVYHNETGCNLHYLFTELAEYLFKQSQQGTVRVNESVLRGFVSYDTQPSRLASARTSADKTLDKTKIEQVESARKLIIDLFLDEKHPHAHEFKLAIRHSLELIYHIRGEDGALKWSNRFVRLQENEALTTRLTNMDIVCMQECTSPDDILAVFTKAGKNMQIIKHTTGPKSKDHCVLMFNTDRFTCEGEPIRTAFEGKKPCIYAKLRDKQSGEYFIASSVHHPGGRHNLADEILANIATLRKPPHERIPYYVAGDYNHTEDFFHDVQHDPREYNIFFAAAATMAGSDYGNVNRSIDAVLTSAEQSEIIVTRVAEIAHTKPAHMPLVLRFENQGKQANLASPSFFHAVKVPTTKVLSSLEEGEKVKQNNPITLLGSAAATFAARPKL